MEALRPETNEVLISILEMMKSQAEYLHRLHGWVIAVTETVQQNPALNEILVNQPFYDQGPRQDVQITQNVISNIDGLIRRLKESQ